MSRLKLTARNVDSIKPPATGRTDYWDTDPKGFGLRVSESGRKTWMTMYRVDGVQRRLTLGTYPALSLAGARQKAKDAMQDVSKGVDPSAVKKAGRKAETFKELAAAYLERYAKKRKRSWQKDEKAIERDLNPAFGNRKANSVTRQDVVRLLERIVERGAPIQANRTHEILRRIFNWAIRAGEAEIEVNPAAGIEKPSKENQREKVLTDGEIRAVWKAMEAQTHLMGAMFKMRLITGQRGGEISRMRWPDIDGNWWTIPGEYSKNGRAHRVPLSLPAMSILDEIRPLTGKQEWVFLSPSLKGPITSIWKATADIRDRSGVGFRPHDLRRTASSLMTGRLGVPRFDVKKILNHVDPDITAIYDRHSYDPEKRRALDAWGGLLEKILADDKAAKAVVPIRQRAG